MGDYDFLDAFGTGGLNDGKALFRGNMSGSQNHIKVPDKAEHILQLWDNFTVPDHLDAAVRSMDHFDHVIPGGCRGQPYDFAAEFETALYR